VVEASKFFRSRTALVWLGVVSLVGALAWAWNSHPLRLRDRVFPRRLVTVYPGFLYRSGQIAPNLIESTLRDLDIKVIVDLTGERGDHAQRTEREVAERLGVAYHSFTLRGSGIGEVDEYARALEVIARADAADEAVLVHCRAGDRRTGGVVAAYQTIVRREPWSRAIEELERFNRKPLEESHLLPYLHENLDDMENLLIERGVLRDAPVQSRDETGAHHLSRTAVDGGRAAN
jgi:protein tyrosine/serine phosphatase